MIDKTKAVNLTEDEISAVIKLHSMHLTRGDEADYPIDRINYLNKRLKTFKEPETIADVEQPKAEIATEQKGSMW